jgi:phosphatidylglycerophosphatase A
MRDRLTRFIATGFGAGLVPFVPGTAGSAVGLGYWWLLTQTPPVVYWSVFIAGLAVALWSAGVTARMMGQPDPSSVVIDELTAVPLALAGVTGWWWVPAFVLFRVFDIWKPWPVCQSQKLPGGWGIVVDDVLAAGYACAVVQILARNFSN